MLSRVVATARAEVYHKILMNSETSPGALTAAEQLADPPRVVLVCQLWI